jgi:hypothetical protein
MSPPKIKPLGRPPRRGKAVPRSDYAAMALLDAFGWPLFCIGQLWCITGTRTGQLIRKWREA